jgi:hypothetical protein
MQSDSMVISARRNMLNTILAGYRGWPGFTNGKHGWVLIEHNSVNLMAYRFHDAFNLTLHKFTYHPQLIWRFPYMGPKMDGL